MISDASNIPAHVLWHLVKPRVHHSGLSGTIASTIRRCLRALAGPAVPEISSSTFLTPDAVAESTKAFVRRRSTTADL